MFHFVVFANLKSKVMNKENCWKADKHKAILWNKMWLDKINQSYAHILKNKYGKSSSYALLCLWSLRALSLSEFCQEGEKLEAFFLRNVIGHLKDGFHISFSSGQTNDDECWRSMIKFNPTLQSLLMAVPVIYLHK